MTYMESITLRAQVYTLKYCARECEKIAEGKNGPLMMTAKYFRALANSAEIMRRLPVENSEWPKPPVGDIG